ncbi:MAG: MFS transporter [Acidobacteriota bacterium]
MLETSSLNGREDVDRRPWRIFRAVAVGHFGIDVFSSMTPVLVAFLRGPLAMSGAQMGLAVGLAQFLSGATQPIFGWVVDRVGTRIIGPVSVAWTMSCVSLAIVTAPLAESYLLFVGLIALGALGSGAFHPQGTMHAATALAGRSATTTSIFFFCGQLGLATGPALSGSILDAYGPLGVGLCGVVFLSIPLFMATQMGSRAANPAPSAVVVATQEQERPRTSVATALLLAGVFGFRAWAFIGTAAFLPILFQEKGWSTTGQGFVTGSFWLGGGAAGVVAGILADRLGRRALVSVTTLLGSLPLFFLPQSEGAGAFALALLAGALLGAPHSTLMVIAQDLLSVRRGLASGLALGFFFAAGALSSLAIGTLADRFALAPVLQAGALTGVVAAALSLLLPSSTGERPA